MKDLKVEIESTRYCNTKLSYLIVTKDNEKTVITGERAEQLSQRIDETLRNVLKEIEA